MTNGSSRTETRWSPSNSAALAAGRLVLPAVASLVSSAHRSPLMVRASAIGLVIAAILVGLWGCSQEQRSAAPASATTEQPADLGASRYQISPASEAAPVPVVTAASPTSPSGAIYDPKSSTPEMRAGKALVHEGVGPGQGGDKYASIEESGFLAVRTRRFRHSRSTSIRPAMPRPGRICSSTTRCRRPTPSASKS
jgi:hypothetical protein